MHYNTKVCNVTLVDGSLMKHATFGDKYDSVVFYCNTCNSFEFKGEFTFTGKTFLSHLHY
jgi:hypothetical protein